MSGMIRMLAVTMGFFVVISGGPVVGQSDVGPVAREHAPEIRDLRVGERYSGGTRVRSPFVGLSFVIPKDWRASLPAGAIVFLDSAVTAGLGTVHLLAHISRTTVLAQLSEPQAIEAGFVLYPVGSLQEEGQKLIGQYAAGDRVGVVVAMLGPSHNAIIYQFVGHKTERELYRQLAEELASSTQFMNERDGPILRAWYERLTGVVLILQRDNSIAETVGSTAVAMAGLSRPLGCSRYQVGRSMERTTAPTTKPVRGGRVQGTKAGLVLKKSTGVVDQREVLHQGDFYLLDGKIASARISDSCL